MIAQTRHQGSIADVATALPIAKDFQPVAKFYADQIDQLLAGYGTPDMTVKERFLIFDRSASPKERAEWQRLWTQFNAKAKANREQAGKTATATP